MVSPLGEMSSTLLAPKSWKGKEDFDVICRGRVPCDGCFLLAAVLVEGVRVLELPAAGLSADETINEGKTCDAHLTLIAEDFSLLEWCSPWAKAARDGWLLLVVHLLGLSSTVGGEAGEVEWVSAWYSLLLKTSMTGCTGMTRLKL